MANPGTLYLFLHGLTVVKERTNNLEVVLPRIPGHASRAGSWLMETPINQRRVLSLEGVKSGGTSFLTTRFTISLAGCSLTSRRRAATLLLPLPKTILELLLVDFPDLVTTRDGTASFSQVATLQVLIYDYDDENDVFLENHYWEPCVNDKTISLHIISTSEGPEGADHEIETENVLARVIRGYPGLLFKKPAPIPPAWNDTRNRNYPNPLPFGLRPQGEYVVTAQDQFAFAQVQLEPIGSRTVRIGRLGRIKQQGRPVEGLWHEPDPLGEYPCNCGAILLR